ncbi:hypothetical protein [Microbacterium maritypicum]
MVRREAPISHRTIDDLPPTTRVRYLRRTLISAGVLPDIDVLLNDLEVYAARLLAALPASEAAMLGRYVRWSLMPLIRRNLQGQPMSRGAFRSRRYQLRLIAEFLEWLRTNDLSMGSVDQPAIDRFVNAKQLRQQIGPFVSWAVKERIAHNVSVTTTHSRGNKPHLSDDELTEVIERVFTLESLPRSTKLITLFALIFAQPTGASVALTQEHVHDAPERMSMTFAKTPVHLPDRLADLVREHLREREATTTHHPNEAGWLFPGTMPNQHVTAASIERIASAHGLSLRRFRSSRLQHFAQSVPASVLADVVGIATDTAYRRGIDAGGVWRGYPGLRETTGGP